MKVFQGIGERIKELFKMQITQQEYLAVVCGGVILGLFLSSGFFWFGGRIIPGVKVAGVVVGGLPMQAAAAQLNARFLPEQQKKVTLHYNQRTFDVVLGTIGIQPDIPATLCRAYATGRSGSIFKRVYSLIEAIRGKVEIRMVFRHNLQVLDSFYRMLDASIGVEPVRAVIRLDPDGRVRYTPSRNGRLIHRKQMTNFFEEAVWQNEKQQFEIPVDTVSPSLTNFDIERWKLDRVLGSYVTMFNPAVAERAHNIKIACSALDNVIVYPGQNFSFNTWIGPRMARTGYKEAPVVIGGKLTPGIGGGVCQVSSTLYNAVLLANLEVVKRYNHTLPSAYVPLGRDATVVDGGLDLIFKNTLATPILLTAVVDRNTVRIGVLGEKRGWENVQLDTEIVDELPFKTIRNPDSQLTPGAMFKVDSGKDGYKVNLWRIVRYSNGKYSKTKINTSIYPAQPEVFKVGAGLAP